MRLTTWGARRLQLALLAALVLAACSKSDSTPAPGPDGSTGTVITITAAGASPRTLVVPQGTQITFVNNDSAPHEMYSDPHPEHTDCPEFDTVGRLTAGQSRQTKNLIALGTCRFHDHINPFIMGLTGSITIR